MGVLSILSHKGDETVEWDKDDPESVAKARQAFLEFLGERKGMAVKLEPDGKKGKMMTDFDPDAERILLIPMVIGG